MPAWVAEKAFLSKDSVIHDNHQRKRSQDHATCEPATKIRISSALLFNSFLMLVVRKALLPTQHGSFFPRHLPTLCRESEVAHAAYSHKMPQSSRLLMFVTVPHF